MFKRKGGYKLSQESDDYQYRRVYIVNVVFVILLFASVIAQATLLGVYWDRMSIRPLTKLFYKVNAPLSTDIIEDPNTSITPGYQLPLVLLGSVVVASIFMFTRIIGKCWVHYWSSVKSTGTYWWRWVELSLVEGSLIWVLAQLCWVSNIFLLVTLFLLVCAINASRYFFERMNITIHKHIINLDEEVESETRSHSVVWGAYVVQFLFLASVWSIILAHMVKTLVSGSGAVFAWYTYTAVFFAFVMQGAYFTIAQGVFWVSASPRRRARDANDPIHYHASHEVVMSVYSFLLVFVVSWVVFIGLVI